MEQNLSIHDRSQYFLRVLRQPPSAVARVRGSDDYPQIEGRVCFYQTRFGVLVSAQVHGLPVGSDRCERPVFAFHIHSGGSCTGNAEDPFQKALAHFNPENCPHPSHAGDLIPLFGNQGYAYANFLTDRFAVEDILGRTVIIHRGVDDFTSQPAGNAGKKIACGLIERSRVCI